MATSVREPASSPAPRPIRPGEEPGLHRLIAACYREYGLTLNLDDACEQHLRDPGAYFRAHGGEFWVVTDEAGLVRASAALDMHAGAAPPGPAELKSMYVDPAWRRRGWGRQLTRMVMDEAKRRGSQRMELWSDTRFLAAHAMYESLGFVRTGERDIDDSNSSREFGFAKML
jgi:putative acetyltransferase